MASEAKKIKCRFQQCEVLKYRFFGMLNPFLKSFFGKMLSEASGALETAWEVLKMASEAKKLFIGANPRMD